MLVLWEVEAEYDDVGNWVALTVFIHVVDDLLPWIWHGYTLAFGPFTHGNTPDAGSRTQLKYFFALEKRIVNNDKPGQDYIRLPQLEATQSVGEHGKVPNCQTELVAIVDDNASAPQLNDHLVVSSMNGFSMLLRVSHSQCMIAIDWLLLLTFKSIQN